MTKRIVPILVLCASLSGHAMQHQVAPIFNTYCGVQLTPETITWFVPNFMTQLDMSAIRAWINAQKVTLKAMVELKRPLLEHPFLKHQDERGVTHPIICPNFAVLHQSINQTLAQHADRNNGLMRNFGGANYIVEIQETNYVAQIAGRLHRVKNLLSANNRPYETPDQLCDAQIAEWPHTYQTVSCFAYYLRAKEAKDTFNLDKIQLPVTCIIGIDTNAPGSMNDDNSILVQENMTNVYPVIRLDRQSKQTSITPEHVRQIAIVAIYASLWDIKPKLLFNPFSRQFVITQFEQPNNSNPRDFFYQNGNLALNHSRASVAQLCELFADVPQLAAVCQKFSALTDDQLKQIASGTLPASIATRL